MAKAFLDNESKIDFSTTIKWWIGLDAEFESESARTIQTACWVDVVSVDSFDITLKMHVDYKMNLRAEVDNKFILRFLIIAVGCFGLMLWGLYDAIYVYPKELDRAVFFKDLEKQVSDKTLTEAERKEQWESKCAEMSWPITKPKTPEIARQNIGMQWAFFGIGLVGGAFFLVKYLNLRNSWMEADEKGVKTSWGQELRFESIKEIDKMKWAKKGIAKVAYSDSSGASKTMVFDDFKYNRENMGKIMRMAEKDLSAEQIINGEREPVEKVEDDIAVIEE